MVNDIGGDFMNPNQDPVSLWIAYYENQKSGASMHSPLTCLSGGGWKTVPAQVVFEFAPGKPINYVVQAQGGHHLAMCYWYFERGRGAEMNSRPGKGWMGF